MQTAQTHICCLTSYSNKQTKTNAKRAGMDSFAVKPIFIKDIYLLLTKAKVINASSTTAVSLEVNKKPRQVNQPEP